MAAPICRHVKNLNRSCFQLYWNRYGSTNDSLDREGGTLTKVVLDNNGVKRITLANPKKRNTLSLEMLQKLHHDFTKDLPNTKAILLEAEGPVFSSGHNLKQLTMKEGSSSHASLFAYCSSFMNSLKDLEVPIIAKVKGLAAAAGCQLVASCDVVVAADTARFSTPGINFGLFCSTPGVAVGRNVPNKIAMRLLLTGEPITAQEALQHGLVSYVCPAADLNAVTEQVLQQIVRHSKPVVGLGKLCFYRQMACGDDTRQAYRISEKVMVDNLSLADGQEGIDAFITKRAPKWCNKAVPAQSEKKLIT